MNKGKKKIGAIRMPIERYCGDCGRKLLPEEDSCPKCGTFHIMEPLSIHMNENGKVEASLKFKNRIKISGQGNKAKEYFRFDRVSHQKTHLVTEKDSYGNWNVEHDEKEKQLKKKEVDKQT